MAVLRQDAWSGDSGNDPAVSNFGSAYVEGNLFWGLGAERSGNSADDFVLSALTGTTVVLKQSTEIANASYRRSGARFYKTLGAGEGTSPSLDNSTTSNKWLTGIEYGHEAGESTWSLIAQASNDNGATSNATSIATTTAAGSGGSGDYLIIADMFRRNGAIGSSPTVYTVDNGLAVDVTNGDTVGDSDGDMMHVVASDGDATAWEISVTFTYDSGDDANSGMNAGILVFDLQAGGGAATNPKGPFGLMFHGPFGGPL